MKDRFRFESKKPTQITVPVAEQDYSVMLRIANAHGTTIRLVASRMIEVGLEEYLKDHAIPPAVNEVDEVDKLLKSQFGKKTR